MEKEVDSVKLLPNSSVDDAVEAVRDHVLESLTDPSFLLDLEARRHAHEKAVAAGTLEASEKSEFEEELGDLWLTGPASPLSAAQIERLRLEIADIISTLPQEMSRIAEVLNEYGQPRVQVRLRYRRPSETYQNSQFLAKDVEVSTQPVIGAGGILVKMRPELRTQLDSLITKYELHPTRESMSYKHGENLAQYTLPRALREFASSASSDPAADRETRNQAQEERQRKASEGSVWRCDVHAPPLDDRTIVPVTTLSLSAPTAEGKQ
jgi:hypothetical protein